MKFGSGVKNVGKVAMMHDETIERLCYWKVISEATMPSIGFACPLFHPDRPSSSPKRAIWSYRP